MKLILANNQSDKFVNFYKDLQTQTKEPFDYSGYISLLFYFDSEASTKVQVINIATGKALEEYDSVYINGYLSNYELAATTAIACNSLGVPFVNHELNNPPSLSKLSMYAKLAAAGVRLPFSMGGTKHALLSANEHLRGIKYPAVLKRADADRGIDNYLVQSMQEVVALLEPHEERSLWILQNFVPNDGFYLVSFYDQQPAFCIYRKLEPRPDGDEQKAHMFKPRGGANASQIEIDQVSAAILKECQQAVAAMDRQIGSVDCLYDPANEQAYILEVNYNPQLVTIETFKEIRKNAFTDYLDRQW